MRTTTTKTWTRLQFAVFATLLTLAAGSFSGNAQAASIAIANAGFEDPALESEPAPCGGGSGCYVGTLTGWTLSGSGGTFNPTNYIPGGAFEGLNTHYSAGSTASQTLVDVLKEGTYTLSVAIGDRADGVAFSSYQVQLGVDNGGFQLLAEDNNSLAPVDGFLTSTVTVDTQTNPAAPANLGSPLVIQLIGTGGGQVQFDDVRLEFVATPVNVEVYLQAQRFNKLLPGGGSVAMWGFATCDLGFTNCALGTDTDAPGPQIDAFAGMGLTVNIQNNLNVPVSVVIPGQAGGGNPVPMGNRTQSFTADIGAGGNGTYEWSGLKSGTYLYQSGTFPSIQVPMGLYGALVVHEDGTQAYDGISPNAEAVVLLSEIDPIQNQRVDSAEQLSTPMTPSCTSMADFGPGASGYPCTIDYDPMYLLINGEPSVNLPAGNPGEVALLRLLNAGLQSHTPAIVGVELGLIAEDGNLYPGLPRQQSAALLAAGKTLDALVTLPGTDITLSMFDRMPTFSNENLPNGGAIGGVVVGGGSVPVDTPPSEAGDDQYGVTEDTPLAIAAPGVLVNDSGHGNATLASAPANGVVALAGDGSFTYTPTADFSGTDSFVYSADGHLATVTLNVSFENDVPVAAPDGPFVNAIGLDVNVAAPGVLGNDQDVDGDTLTAVIEGTAPSGLTLNPDGSFTYTGGSATTFAYRASDGTDVSLPVTVTIQTNPVAGISLTVVDPLGNPVTDYRWLVQEENTYINDLDAPAPIIEQQSLNFHKSYMPVIAQGLSQPDCAVVDCDNPGVDDPAMAISIDQVALDPFKQYYVSVLPNDAGLSAAGGLGHTIGGAQILPGQTAVTVTVNNQEIPLAQISVLVFDDRSPTNGVPDADEPGLGGFQIVLEDAGGRYGMSGGTMSQDAFGVPLKNSLACAPSAAPGIILTCPDGSVLVKNLPPGKYGVIAVAPTANWTQTSTIEGSKVIDAWVKAGEPEFFLEFGNAAPHAFIGFVDPASLDNPGGDNSFSGMVSLLHDPRPPGTPGTSDSQSYNGLSHTRAWVGLNTIGGDGANIQTVQADPDGSFSMTNIPDGTHQLVVWDAYLDQVIAFQIVNLPADNGRSDVNVPVNAWFTRSEHNVFLDANENGIWDADEAPLAEQAVNLRWRDGTINQSFPTDGEGFVPFDQTFPFFSWQVLEVDYTRFKATGLTVTVDAGGDVTAASGTPYPGLLALQDGSPRTETGQVLTQGFQGFPGQTSIFEWGKKPYAPGENGGISGIVFYGSTRGENDPRLTVGDPWEPGIPRVKVRLYKEVPRDPSIMTPIAVVNAGFEDPALPPSPVSASYNFTLTGWELTGTGGTFNPTNFIPGGAAEGVNTHYSNGSEATQVLGDNLQEGSYFLTVAVGDRTDAGFPGYQVQLGVISGGTFSLLAEDDSSQAPADRFLTSSVNYTATDSDIYMGLPLAVRLIGNGSQVNFDDVQLNYTASTGLVLVQEVMTDSWDDSIPDGCPGEDPDQAFTTQTLGVENLTRCYDGWRNWNQARPAVFDGGYAFNDIPAGKYIVEVVPPPGYELIKEQDLNVGFGDVFALDPTSPFVPVSVVLPNGTLVPYVPDAAMVQGVMGAEPGLAQPPCVGALHTVPDELSLFPGMETGFAGAHRPLCDRKEVVLSDQGQAAADFHLFTSTPVAAQFTGLITDDISAETNPASPGFGEKWSPAYLPFSIRDYNGLPVYRGVSDAYGRYNGVLPSTFTANIPIPSGYSPAMMSACLNDEGPTRLPNFGTACYTAQFMPGATTYLDTPILPNAAFAAGFNAPDCSAPQGTPVIASVGVQGGDFGPLVAPSGTLRIDSLGQNVDVPNPAYEGPLATAPFNQPFIQRDFDFGQDNGKVEIVASDGSRTELAIVNWNRNVIRVTAPATPMTGQLVVTRADNGNQSTNSVTVTVSNSETPIRVFAGGSIQAAIDAASPGALILVESGTYNERLIMSKPVRLQGSGSATVINAQLQPTETLQAWLDKLASILPSVDLLPGQTDLLTEQGAGVTVLAKSTGPNRFVLNPSRVDGFTITGAEGGGGVYVNGYAHNIEISNNTITHNSGTLHGGIRVGKPFLPDLVPNANGVITFNNRVNIHDNVVTLNGARHFESAGGGISMSTGSSNYNVTNNFVCGNFTAGDGAGIGHLGVSVNGTIAFNTVMYNQSYNQGITQHGGGIFIGGEPAAPPALTLGAGNVFVDANLIQGNLAGSGHGGGIRTQLVNGSEIAIRTNPWLIRLTNNMVVNNVAAWAGAGISLQDTVNSVVVNNTVANNDSTATVGGLIDLTTNTSDPQPAGIVAERHSPDLAAALAVVDGFSSPISFQNNIVWHNRSFSYDAANVSGLAPELAPASVGACDETGVAYWDLGVLGEPLVSPALQLDPRRGILSAETTGYSGTNISGDPDFLKDYCNGARTLSAPGPILATGAFGEGGNFIDLRYGPLTPEWPVGSGAWNYHIGGASAGLDNANNAGGTNPPYDHDIDNDARPIDAGGLGVPSFKDRGADEYVPPPPVPTLDSVTPSTGPRGSDVEVVLTGTGLTGATAIDISGGNGVSFVDGSMTVDSDTQITATFSISNGGGQTGDYGVIVTTPGGISNAVIFTKN